MPRRRREDEVPGFFQMMTELAEQEGYGWAVELAKLLALVALVGLAVGAYFLIQHLVVSGMQEALNSGRR